MCKIFSTATAFSTTTLAATFVATLTGILRQGVLVPGKDDSVLSYLPLAHILERGVVHLMLMQGARVAFSRGDMKVLGDDILALRPTVFVGVLLR